jgi:hypothetical protein
MESVGKAHVPIVGFFAAGEFKYKKEPRVGAKFVNALAQIVTTGVDKNVSPDFDDGVHRFADFRMKERLRSPQPNSGRGDRTSAISALFGCVPFKFGCVFAKTLARSEMCYARIQPKNRARGGRARKKARDSCFE